MKMLSGITKGLPQSGLQAGAGGGLFYLHRMLAQKVKFLQDHPLAAPIGLIVLGHVLKKVNKAASLAPAVVGAGGYALAQTYEVRKAVTAVAATQAANTPASSGIAGFEDDDTGALVKSSDIGMLLNPSNVGDVGDPTDAYSDAYAL